MGRRHIVLPDKLEGLFIRLEEIVLANSGEDEFEEIFKLILAKLWCETNSINAFEEKHESEDLLETIDALLSQVKEKWSGVILDSHVKLSSEHLRICVALLSNYNLLSFGYDALDAFFEFIVSKTSKGAKGQFFTPRHIVEFCTRVLSPNSSESILDPACGSGAFLTQYHNYITAHENNNLNQDIGLNMWGFDFDDRALRISRTLMHLNKVSSINIYKSNSLLTPNLQEDLFNDDNSTLTTIEDYLRLNKKRNFLFDIIATNPPFGGEVNENHILEKYQLSKGKKKIERDALFVERCINMLKPNGRMAIILPNNKLGTSNWSYLRKWVLQNARVLAVVGLPRSTFMPHTSVKTSIIFIQKREKPVAYPINEKIFFGISEKSGKDTRGNLCYVEEDSNIDSYNRIDHDLHEIENQILSFFVKEKIGWVENGYLHS